MQRANLEYNAEGKFLSLEEGVIYTEQAKEVYGIFALIGVISTGLFIYRLIKSTNKK